MIKLKQITKFYHASQPILNNLSVSFEAGEICALLGKSGGGKTTLLRVISGLETVNSGQLFINNKDVTKLHPNQRCMGFVFQSFALFPHLTVAENISFASKSLNAEQRSSLLKMIELEAYEHSLPSMLSGGQKQRVAIARALATESPILLLDEPFSNLDTHVKERMKYALKSWIKAHKQTVIYATHDVKDALEISDSIAVLSEGTIIQKSTPNEIYTSPKSAYIASLFGEINLLSEHICTQFNIKMKKEISAIRIEDVSTSYSDIEGYIKTRIVSVKYCGAYYQLELEIDSFKVNVSSYTNEDTIYIHIPKEQVLFF